ncbi:hypothetical protein F4806DRAFT_320457 [Annulohypoxylon nitens]|nr:hypothetical protein F4806DRAFT_320457 [Annulohypoxylon nitens]
MTLAATSSLTAIHQPFSMRLLLACSHQSCRKLSLSCTHAYAPRARFGLSMVRYSLVFFFHLLSFQKCFSLCVHHMQVLSLHLGCMYCMHIHPSLIFFLSSIINSFYHYQT